MSLLPARLQINDPAFRLGEKVQPAKPEPAPCPYAAFERGDCGGPEHVPRRQETRANASDAGGPAATNPQFGATVKADPDGWFPHDGGPCPVDGEVRVLVRLRKDLRGVEGQLEVRSAEEWVWTHEHCFSDITAYKLATPPKPKKQAPKAQNTDPNGPGTDAWKLKVQQQRQREGLPVEWDKVPVGSKVWVRDGNTMWFVGEWKRLTMDKNFPYRDSDSIWQFCKLHIEGVAP